MLINTADKAVVWSFFTLVARFIKGPITVFFVVRYLDLQQQGIWYAFLSLGALSVFAELGFTRIVSVFVSHEKHSLHERCGFLFGKKSHLDKLWSLVGYSLKMYLFIVPIAVVLLIVVGYFFFIDYARDIFYVWVIFSILTGFNLFLSLLQSIFIGLDNVELANKNIVTGTLLSGIVTWVSLAGGLLLWSLPISILFSVVISLFLLWRRTKRLVFQYFKNSGKCKVKWAKEIIPLQWRYAVSFISGYLSFQLYVPTIFHFEGAEKAGQFGLSYAFVSILLTVGSVWLNAHAPMMTIAIAKRNFNIARKQLNHDFVKGTFLFILGMGAILFTVYMMNLYQYYNNRILSITDISLLLISQFSVLFIGFIGVYCRLFKEEVLLKLGLIQSALMIALLLFGLPRLGLTYVLMLIAIFQWFLFLPIAYKLFMPFYNRTS